jgi:hypothetical protein
LSVGGWGCFGVVWGRFGAQMAPNPPKILIKTPPTGLQATSNCSHIHRSPIMPVEANFVVWVRSFRGQDQGQQKRSRGRDRSGTRKMVLRRRVPKEKSQKCIIVAIETASCLRENLKERWGASPPTFPDGSLVGRRPFRPPKSSTVGFHLQHQGFPRPGSGPRRPENRSSWSRDQIIHEANKGRHRFSLAAPDKIQSKLSL